MHLYTQGTASTLTRSEVRGGGRKPYKQKGSGNARRGSRRSPLMPGGGISFGPKPRDWSIDMNKKERRLALATALQSAAADMLVVPNFGALQVASTKALLAVLAAVGVQEVRRGQQAQWCAVLLLLGAKATLHRHWAPPGLPQGEKTLIVLGQPNEAVYLSGRNVPTLAINTADRLQVFDVLGADRIVMERAALDYINEFYGSRSGEAE